MTLDELIESHRHKRVGGYLVVYVETGELDILEIWHSQARGYCLDGTYPQRFIKRGTLDNIKDFVAFSGLYEILDGDGEGLAT